MSRGKELVKNTAIVAVGRVCTKLLSFFLLPFYTAVLSAEDYGIVDLFNTYISLLLPLIVFQIEDALFRFSIDVRDDEAGKKKVVSTVLLFCTFQSVVFSILFVIVQLFVNIPYRWYLLINVVVSIFSGSMLQLTRGMGDNLGYAFSSFLTAFSAILLNIVLVLFMDMGADGLFITAFVSNVIGIIYIIIKEKVYGMFHIARFDGKLLKEMLAYSLPLVPNYLSWWVIGASDKTVVTWILGVAQSGILSVSQKFSTAYTTFYSIFNLTWTENAAIHRDDEDSARYYSRIIETSFRVLACACLGIVAGVALVFPLLVNEKFGASYYQIPIYMLSSLLYSCIGIFSVVYIAFKKTGEIAKTSLLAAVINLVVNIALIRFIGLYAASVSSAVAYGVLFMFRYFDIQKMMKITIGSRVTVSVVVMMIIDFAVYYVRIDWLSAVNLALVLCYALYLNRTIIREIIEVIKGKIRKGENNDR